MGTIGPPRSTRGVGAGVLSTAAVCLVIAVLLAPPAPAVAGSHVGPAAAPRGTHLGPRATSAGAASAALAAARASLAQGEGPAGGVPLACTDAAASASCTSEVRARVPGIPRNLAGGASASSTYPAYVAPPGRLDAAVTLFLNGSSFGVLLFGGVNYSETPGRQLHGNGTLLGDTWQFDPGDHTWWNVTSQLACSFSASCPSPRWGASATFDYADGYALLFGGCANSTWAWQPGHLCFGRGDLLGDTWTYTDANGGVGNWTRVAAGQGPGARFSAGLAYDGLDGYTILFGGCAGRCPLGDTWSYLQGTWTQLFTTGGPFSPPARFGMAMAELGAGGPVAMFGGCGSLTPGCDAGLRVWGDTWVFYANSWTEFQDPSNCTLLAPCPSPRFDAAFTTYAGPGLAGGLLVYGGLGAGESVLGAATEPGGTGWWFYGGDPLHWTALDAPPGWNAPADGLAAATDPGSIVGEWGQSAPPMPRFGAALEGTPYGGFVLFGGASPLAMGLDDTWAASFLAAPPSFLSYSGLIGPVTDPPPATGAKSVFDGADGRTVLVDGCGFVCPNASTWEYAPYSASARLSPWSPVVPPYGAFAPSARSREGLTFDPFGGGQVLLFGGEDGSYTYLNDLWSYAGGRWTQLFPQGPAPPGRAGAVFVYDSSANAVLLFGGENATVRMGDTWLLAFAPSTASWTWSELGPGPSPSARTEAAGADDPAIGGVLLFGGCGASACPLGDTWSFVSNGWVRCETASCDTSGPSPRWGAAMAYDPVLGGPVLFGGCAAHACPADDTWSFGTSGSGNWSSAPSALYPAARYDAALDWDPNGGYLLLWGGTGPGGGTLGGPGWEYGPNGWSSPAVAAFPPAFVPPSSFGASMVYDPLNRYVLLVGGCLGSDLADQCTAPETFSATWEFADGTWRLVCANCGPPPRWLPFLVYDHANGDNYTLLFGGCPGFDPSGGRCQDPLSDTWKFANGTWTPIRGTAPSARADGAIAFDPVAGPHSPSVILYGGWSGTAALGDTWQFVGGNWTRLNVSCSGCTMPPLVGASMAFDPLDLSLDMYGGREGGRANGTFSDTLWTLDLQALAWRPAGQGPVAESGGTLVFDPSWDRMLLVGGVLANGSPSGALEEYPAAGSPWGPAIPLPAGWGARFGAAAVFDPLVGSQGWLILFGGVRGPTVSVPVLLPSGTGPGQGDTWAVGAQGDTWYDVSPIT
jgi:hypothetical protein